MLGPGWSAAPFPSDGGKLRLYSHVSDSGVNVKKGRHRRFEEARNLKRAIETVAEPCPECGAEPGREHASWCLAMEDDELEDEDEYDPSRTGPSQR